jgi:NAD(P)-dependent dehydrogenase (short-subunit alcohol dehydrogenase family)
MTQDRFSLRDKVAVITGGAGDIGAVYAEEMCKAGASVVIADLNGAAAAALAKTLTDAGHRAIGVTVDVTSPDSATAMIAAATEAFGGVDILVNNAAIMTELPPYGLRNIPLDEWNKVMAVNVTGPLLCSQAAARSMTKRGGGRIVNGLSAGAFIPGGIYSISKIALNALTINLANEFGQRGINVNAIAPGYVESDSGYAALPKDSEFREAIMAPIPGKKSGPPSDLVGALLLCSAAGDWINGQTIIVDGGWITRL